MFREEAALTAIAAMVTLAVGGLEWCLYGAILAGTAVVAQRISH